MIASVQDKKSLPPLRTLLHTFFPELNAEERERLAGVSFLRPFSKGEELGRTGECPGRLSLVVCGEIKLIRELPDGKALLLHLIHPGKMLDAGVLFGNGDLFASAVGLGDGVLLSIEASSVLKLITENSGLALRFLTILAARQKMLAHKIAGSQGRISVARRVAGWLLHRSKIEGSTTLLIPVSREVMAGQLGIARESLSRQLNSFARAGLIHLERGRIELTDCTALMQASLE